MKKFFPFIIFCMILMTSNSYSQTYHPLLENNKYWDVRYFDNNSLNPVCHNTGGERYFLNGDTIIHNKTYKKISAYSFIWSNQYFCPPYLVDTISYFTNKFIREDSIQKQVFYYDNYIYFNYSDCIINDEVLLYDFNYVVGDTLKCVAATFGDCNFNCRVDSVVNGITYFYSNNIGSSIMVEGAGGSIIGGGLFQSLLVFESGSYLDCLYKKEFTGNNNCANFITKTHDINILENEFEIFPNPATDYINIKTKSTKEPIFIYDIMGNATLSIRNPNNDNKVDISTILKGLYIIQTGNSYFKLIKL